MNESTGTQSQSIRSALPRRYEIDALRSIALFLLIVYHVFCAFQPFAPLIMFIGSSDTLKNAWFLGELINPWRIPVLFLISGITTGYLLQNRPVKKLLKSRIMRLVPPLLLTWFCIGPISPALFQSFHGEAGGYMPNPGHLWFVSNLVVYFILGVPLLLYVKHRPDNLLLRLLRPLSPYGWLLLLPAALALTTLFLEPHVSPDMFSTHFIRFWYGFACFLFGIVLVSLDDHFWRGIRSVCHVALPAALTLYLMRMAEVDFGGRSPALIVRTMESVYGMLAFLGYGSLVFSRPSRFFAVLNRAVFAVYIIHLPVQQAVGYYLFRLELNPWPAFALHLIATLAVSALIYAFILRPLHWLHPFFGIAPLKSEPARPAEAAETTPTRPPWPILVGRFAALYVVSPLLVLGTIVTLASLPALQLSVDDDSRESTQFDSSLKPAVERFRGEIASRSAEENQREAGNLTAHLKRAMEEGNIGRAYILALEIQLIMEALENRGVAEANRSQIPYQESIETDPRLRQFIERIRGRTASRSADENRRVAESLIASMEEAMEAENPDQAKDLALEIQIIMEALEN